MQRFQAGPGFIRHHALQGLLTGVLAFCSVVALALIDIAVSRRSASALMSETTRTVLDAVDASSRHVRR
jgi:hypothetical protein